MAGNRDQYKFDNGYEAGQAARKVLKSLWSTPSMEDKMPKYSYEPLMHLRGSVESLGWDNLPDETLSDARMILRSLWSTPSMQDKMPKYSYEPLMMLQDFVDKYGWEEVEGI